MESVSHEANTYWQQTEWAEEGIVQDYSQIFKQVARNEEDRNLAIG